MHAEFELLDPFPFVGPTIAVTAASDDALEEAAGRSAAAQTHARSWSPATSLPCLIVAIHADLVLAGAT